MKKEIKKAWVAALRSGKYKQCTQELYDGEGFCCLGVLADIRRKELKQGREVFFNKVREEANGDMLSDSLVAWSGIKSEGDSLNQDPSIKWGEGKKAIRLSTLNDDGESFSEIADLIEKSKL